MNKKDFDLRIRHKTAKKMYHGVKRNLKEKKM